MSRTAPPPRFRIRLEDGSELPISSVEALARRVSRGDVLPETPLFDAGTGAWTKAGDALVVKFILEQIQEEGSETPPGWKAADSSGDASSVGASSQEEPPHEPAAFPGPAALDFSFTLADMPEVDAPRTPDRSASGLSSATAESPPLESPPLENPPETTWRPAAADSLAVPPPPSPPEDWTPPGDSWASPPVESTLTRPWKEPPRAAESRAEVDWAELDAQRDAEEEKEERQRMVVGALIVVGLLLGGGWILGIGFGGEDAGPESIAPEAVLVDPGPVPAGLEAEVEAAVTRFDLRMQETVDSLQNALDLPEEPAREWLSGYYMANAREFSEMREFWVSYQTFVQSLRSRERPLLAVALAQGRTGDGVETRQMVSYLTARYEWTLRGRQERYDRLMLAATRAVEFHDFLVASESGLRYTPARGSQLPNDPVLEIAATDPALQTELNNRLDALLSALDRSRGGALPSATGLGPELFAGFGGL